MDLPPIEKCFVRKESLLLILSKGTGKYMEDQFLYTHTLTSISSIRSVFGVCAGEPPKTALNKVGPYFKPS